MHSFLVSVHFINPYLIFKFINFLKNYYIKFVNHDAIIARYVNQLSHTLNVKYSFETVKLFWELNMQKKFDNIQQVARLQWIIV